ncbi:hypothetical protein L1987_46395 [Smallanthus sonchifolius]|uniref:Uncharacterized protein n=1 Tax=Smallanthus sonchifolius TaxID=185202 RepID=A0ACB9FZB8_9ASTR|nr:hypothetical protein L1987_46395 [Smallanthus sonchifolius]
MYPRFIQKILNENLKNLSTIGRQLKLTPMGHRIFDDMRESKVEYRLLFDHMYSKARLLEIRQEDNIQGDELESECPRKKQKTRQDGLDEDILNLLSEASRNETSLLRSQIMAMKDREEDTERQVTMLKQMVLSQNLMIEALKKTFEKLSGIVTKLQSSKATSEVAGVLAVKETCSLGANDKTILEVVDEVNEDNNDDDGEGDNPDKDKPKGNDDQGMGDGGAVGAYFGDNELGDFVS